MTRFKVLLLFMSVLVITTCNSAASDAFFDAIGTDNIAKVTKLLKSNPKLVNTRITIDYNYPVSSTPLHYAASRGSLPIVKLLLSKGAKVNGKDSNGNTPLYEARGKEILSALISHGASLKVRNTEGDTPLAFAISHSNDELAHILRSKGAPITTIHEAVYFGDVRKVQHFLSRNRKLINKLDSSMQSPLVYAVNQNCFNMIKFLVEHGADVKLCDWDGFTPLIIASGKGNIQIVRYLLAHGANVNESSPQGGDTALTRAALNGNPELVRLLISKGANALVTSWVPSGCGPLPPRSLASSNGLREVTPYEIAVACKHKAAADILKQYMDNHKKKSKEQHK